MKLLPSAHSPCSGRFQRKCPHARGPRGSWGSRGDRTKAGRRPGLQQKGSPRPAFTHTCHWLGLPRWVLLTVWLKAQQLQNPQAVSWVFVMGHSIQVQVGRMVLGESPQKSGWRTERTHKRWYIVHITQEKNRKLQFSLRGRKRTLYTYIGLYILLEKHEANTNTS